MTRIQFLREQTVSGANKCRRAPMPPMSVAEADVSLPERKALALCAQFDTMPVYIGPRELIVGTRTWYAPNPGNEDGHDPFGYGLFPRVAYLNGADIAAFGGDQSYMNRTHFTPDFGIVLTRGIGGILREAEAGRDDPARPPMRREYLSAVAMAYRGLQRLILRYAAEAEALAEDAHGGERDELLAVAATCRRVSQEPPATFREALQLLWFTHLGTMVESCEFVNYGRLDVLLCPFLGDTPHGEALELVACLLLKMYDQADLVTTYLGKYAAQLVVTLGGVLPNGESAVNEVTMLFLEAIPHTRLPEPEFNLRVSSKNPPAFLDKAAELTVSGCNFVSYYNDDLFVESLCRAGIPPEYARDYGFDLCQDINVPGRGDFWLVGAPSLAHILLGLLEEGREYPTFESLLGAYKARIAHAIAADVARYNTAEAQLALYAAGDTATYFDNIHRRGLPVDRGGNTPMAPLPLLSALYHGCLEQGLDVALQPFPVKEKGMFFGTSVEAVNSLAAIRRVVYDEGLHTLGEVTAACRSNFDGEAGRAMQTLLWSCPKWGNDDDFVDGIAKELLEFCLRECESHTTHLGGRVLGGIHQPHPVPTGGGLGATPDGRPAGAPVAVTLTPASGTMREGPTAALNSAAKLDPMLVQWNFCVMVNYTASLFKRNGGGEIFKALLQGYFEQGGLQHQPQVQDAEELRRAQKDPEAYRDLIVRLWGVSAYFVDLPPVLQEEIIQRFEA